MVIVGVYEVFSVQWAVRRENWDKSSQVTRELIMVKTKSADGDGKLSVKKFCLCVPKPLRYSWLDPPI